MGRSGSIALAPGGKRDNIGPPNTPSEGHIGKGFWPKLSE